MAVSNRMRKLAAAGAALFALVFVGCDCHKGGNGNEENAAALLAAEQGGLPPGFSAPGAGGGTGGTGGGPGGGGGGGGGVVPEINPGATAASLALVIGTILVVLDRRRTFS